MTETELEMQKDTERPERVEKGSRGESRGGMDPSRERQRDREGNAVSDGSTPTEAKEEHKTKRTIDAESPGGRAGLVHRPCGEVTPAGRCEPHGARARRTDGRMDKARERPGAARAQRGKEGRAGGKKGKEVEEAGRGGGAGASGKTPRLPAPPEPGSGSRDPGPGIAEPDLGRPAGHLCADTRYSVPGPARPPPLGCWGKWGGGGRGSGAAGSGGAPRTQRPLLLGPQKGDLGVRRELMMYELVSAGVTQRAPIELGRGIDGGSRDMETPALQYRPERPYLACSGRREEAGTRLERLAGEVELGAKVDSGRLERLGVGGFGSGGEQVRDAVIGGRQILTLHVLPGIPGRAHRHVPRKDLGPA
ncbi:hypothetical protein P7K49_034457 [Saguinus oedipus]|uniref:Uncharacterized protein n=1 Tax=Saguinus oedipus TaxID=9490 RepID=A0ABQ9TUT5_SAGOE|nr:hypothetical protein P7K49_034457 [Saguinus oedipus]